jgi:hypothetical protein
MQRTRIDLLESDEIPMRPREPSPREGHSNREDIPLPDHRLWEQMSTTSRMTEKSIPPLWMHRHMDPDIKRSKSLSRRRRRGFSDLSRWMVYWDRVRASQSYPGITARGRARRKSRISTRKPDDRVSARFSR